MKLHHRKMINKALARILIFALVLTAFMVEPGSKEQVSAASYYRLPSGTNQKLIETAATFLGYPYPYNGKSPNTNKTTGTALDCSKFIDVAVEKAGFENVPGSTLAWSSQIKGKSLNITYGGQAIQTFYFSSASALVAAKEDPNYAGCLLVLTTPTMEVDLTNAGALTPGTLMIRYGSNDLMRHASMIVGTVEPRGMVTRDAFRGKNILGDPDYALNTFSYYYNSIKYYEQVYKEFSYLFAISKSSSGICDKTYLMLPFLRSEMQYVSGMLTTSSLKTEYDRLSNVVTVAGDKTAELIDKTHAKSTENVLKYSVNERYAYLVLFQVNSGTSKTPRRLSDGKDYYGVGDSSVWKIESMSQRTGVAITNDLHNTDTVGAYIVCFNELENNKYSQISMIEYDGTNGSQMTGSSYILTDQESVAREYASGIMTSPVLDTITLVAGKAVSFKAACHGNTTVKEYYVAQAQAVDGWIHNPGYWRITVSGVSNTSGSGSKVTDVVYCHYMTDLEVWFEDVLTTSAADADFYRGYLYATGSTKWMIVPRQPEYYFSLSAVIANDTQKSVTSKFAVGTGWDKETGGLTGLIGEPVSVSELNTSLFSGIPSRTIYNVETFYLKEQSDLPGLNASRVWEVTMIGVKADSSGKGAVVQSAGYYTDESLSEFVPVQQIDPETLELISEFSDMDLLPFTDVTYGTWQYNTAKFVYENGIIKGTTPTTFSPNAYMTRGQFITMLWRMEGSEKTEYQNCYSDVSADLFCASAIQWAYNNNLIAHSMEKCNPNSYINREQFMTFLYRYAKFKGYDMTVKNNRSYLSADDPETISSFAIETMNWAYEQKLIAANGKFNAKGYTTRIEAAAMLMRFIQKFN